MCKLLLHLPIKKVGRPQGDRFSANVCVQSLHAGGMRKTLDVATEAVPPATMSESSPNLPGGSFMLSDLMIEVSLEK